MIRPFEDLIKPIEIDGETFVPIEEIAKLALNVINIEMVEPSITQHRHNARLTGMAIFNYGKAYIEVVIQRDFDIATYINQGKETPYNQVQIVKNLIKWGFVKP